jgi:hypothetical protein
MGVSSDRDDEAWNHSAEIVSSVEAIFELGEISRRMPFPHGGPNLRNLDVD